MIRKTRRQVLTIGTMSLAGATISANAKEIAPRMQANAQPAPAQTNLELAQRALAAWQKGEQGGDYGDFKALLSPNFRLFAHPTVALGTTIHQKAALEQILSLIREREQRPNHLTFSHPTFAQGTGIDGELMVVVQFDSEGTLANGKKLKDRNAIAFGLENNQIIGYREYFGVVDPDWFK